MNYWLIIHTYTYFSIINEEILFYNSLSNDYLISKDAEIYYFLKELKIEENLNIIKISEKHFQNENISIFLDNLKSKFMADILPINISSKKPVQFPKYPKLQLDIDKKSKKLDILEGENILDNIYKFNLYINVEKNAEYENAYKQFPFIINSEQELDYELIRDFFDNYNLTNLNTINIIGNVNYSKILQLLKYFNDKPFVITVLLNFNTVDLDFIQKTNFHNVIYNFYFIYPYDTEKLEKLLFYKNINFEFSFPVENNEQFENINKIINNYLKFLVSYIHHLQVVSINAIIVKLLINRDLRFNKNA